MLLLGVALWTAGPRVREHFWGQLR
jgi:hypothetical protein